MGMGNESCTSRGSRENDAVVEAEQKAERDKHR